mgnify:CR=1 FL=1
MQNYSFERNNKYKGRKAPIEIPKEAGSSISPQVYNLPPVILDNFHHELVENGYHVVSSGSLQRTFHLTIFFRLRMFNCTQRSWQGVAQMRARVLVDLVAKSPVGKRR